MISGNGLESLRPETMKEYFQISDENPMAGFEGRCRLLVELGAALKARPDVCETGRPGDMLSAYYS